MGRTRRPGSLVALADEDGDGERPRAPGVRAVGDGLRLYSPLGPEAVGDGPLTGGNSAAVPVGVVASFVRHSGVAA